MKQTLHILCKDVRALWLQILLTLGATGAFCVAFSQSAMPHQHEWQSIVCTALPVAYVWLVLSVVQQEALPGERQFWLTRPYRRVSLFAAKAVFVLLFVTGGLMAKDCIVVAENSFAVEPLFAGILLRTLAWTIWIGVSAFAVATVTRNIREFVLAGALIVIAALAVEMTFQLNHDWANGVAGTLVMVFGGSLVVLLQYWRRSHWGRKAAMAWALAAFYCFLLLGANAKFAIRSLLTPQTNSTAVGVERGSHGRPFVDSTLGIQRINFPLKLTGLIPNAFLKVDGVRASALSNAGYVDLSAWREGQMINDGNGFWVSLILAKDNLRKIAARPVTLFLTLEMTTEQLEQPTLVKESASEFSVGAMRCSTISLCKAAVNTVPNYWVLYLDAAGNAQQGEIGTYSDRMMHTDFSESPVTTVSLKPEYAWLPQKPTLRFPSSPHECLVYPITPQTHFRRDIEFRNVRLEDSQPNEVY